MKASFRCRSMSEQDVYHHIIVPVKGHILCSCQGVNWCSHIEATLAFGERYMVHPEDIVEANRAQTIAQGKLEQPDNWKSDWRKNRKWRGIPERKSKAYGILMKGVPVVSFQGIGSEKKEAKEIANENGWAIVKTPTKGVIVHVVLDGKKTDKTKHAEKIGALIVNKDEWPSVAKIGKTLRSHMTDLLNKGSLS